MEKSLPWVRGRGLERLLAREANISDLIQFFTDRDPVPWGELVGFIPDDIAREALKLDNQADLRLTAAGRTAMIEVKLGHLMSEKQQAAYESIPTGPDLYMAGLGSDQGSVPSGDDRWTFLSLGDLIGAWERSSEDELARLLAAEAAGVLRSWDAKIAGVFSDRSSPAWAPLSSLTQKFLARVATRRIAKALQGPRRWVGAYVTSGGGLPVVQAWTPIRGEGFDRSFIAEVRWCEKPGGELRFGVDFEPRPGCGEDEEVRRAAYGLAHSMDAAIHYEGLKAHLPTERPELAQLLHRRTGSRPAAKGDWEQVIVHGYAGAPLPGGGKNNRTRTRPDFYGDGALRHEALVDIDFGQASALDLIELLDVTLNYLSERQPR